MSTPPLDRRGHCVSANKTPDEKIKEIKYFINSIPSYDSHYSLHKSQNRKFLAPDLNLSILYSLYTEKVANPTSKFIFNKVFNEEFNLSFHAPVTDSCKRCDALAIKLNDCCNEVDKLKLEQEKKHTFAQSKSSKRRCEKGC